MKTDKQSQYEEDFIIIIAILLPLLASATYINDIINGINYNLNSSTKTAEVRGVSYSGDVIIPSHVTYNGVTYTVTSIGIYAFWPTVNNDNVFNSVTIPNTVTNIGEAAFRDCNDISIHITDLEAWCKINFNTPAFSYFDGNDTRNYYYRLYLNGKEITDLIIPDVVTSIRSNTFTNCTSITSVTIPNSVTSIGSSAFSGCYRMPSVTIPNSVTSIGSSAFSGCSSLTSVTIPNSVTSIGNNAFSGTPWFNNQPNGLVYAGNVAYKYKNKYKEDMPKNTSIIIEDGTVGIADDAFSDCSGLISITIPNSVISIGSSAFYNCSGLASVNISDLAAWCNIKFSSSNCNPLYYAHHLYINGNEITNLVIPNDVTSIGNNAFCGCSGLTSITIPNSVTSIGNNAFRECSSLTSILSLNNTPPTFDSKYIFYNVNMENCVLWVPKGCANAYREADGWKDFQNIRELAFGDVNIDFEVNQADLDATVDFIMDKDPEGFFKSLADLNGDEAVDAADVVKLVTILNLQEGLNMDWQANYSNQVISSLSCTLNNDGDKTIQLTKCELYCNQSLVSSANFKVTLASGGSKKCSFDELENLSSITGFSLVWYYTYNGEDYTYRCEIEE